MRTMKVPGKILTSLVAVWASLTGVMGGRLGYHLGNLGKPPLNHLVEGDIYVLDHTRLRINGFSYDGLAPDAFFYVGTTGKRPSGAGTKMPDENGKLVALGSYNKKTVTLILPLGVMWKDVKWISIWCVRFGVDFGHVTVSDSLQVPAPRNVGQFSRLAHGLRSGSVVILDSKRIMISNLYYDGQGPDAYFIIGNGRAPTRNGKKIPDENGRTTKLKAYTGRTIMLTLPDGVTFYDFNWLSMWCILARQNFGHVIIPSDLNVPPYAPKDNWNCEEVDTRLQVSWEVKNSNINFRLLGILADSEYMSFGLSGSNSASRMVGGDVVVASYDGTPKAVDYKMTQKAQCSNGRGVCPDVQQSGQGSFTEISGSRINGLTTISYTRALNTGDAKDTVIDKNRETFVIWAIGRLNPDKIATKHDTRIIGNLKMRFGRTPFKNCPPFSVQTGGTPAPVTPWIIPALSGQTTKVFTARIGQTGGARGYSAITGTNSWGIAWYINDLLIPEITLKRNEAYTFIVEGGADTTNTARYHPFYITDDKNGGFVQLSQSKKQQVKVFAGISSNGELKKGAVGRLCEWNVKQGIDATNKKSFEEFFKTLELKCDKSNNNTSGRLTWTPDSNTPDLVYYQCYTHRYLGWKIHIVDDYAKPVVPCSKAGCSHYCRKNKDTASAECYCPPSYQLVSSTTCREKGPVDATTKRCQCSLRMDIQGAPRGPKLFDLPTLSYDGGKTWLQTRNGTKPIEAVYPNWVSEWKQTMPIVKPGTDIFRNCFEVLSRCPRDCRRLTGLYITDGLRTSIRQDGGAGYFYNPLGQVMCHNAKSYIPGPGVRLVVFYDGFRCGRGSTYVLPTRLCCSVKNIPVIGSVAFWNSNCSDKFDISSLIG